jgi:hypothetical protein
MKRHNAVQPTLPGDFEPPPPECPVRNGEHYCQAIRSYTKTLYWPAKAYEPYCLYCGITVERSHLVGDQVRTRAKDST